FGQIAAVGTLGGLLGALLAARVAATLGAPAMLLFLAALQCLTARLLRGLATSDGAPARSVTPEPASDGSHHRSAIRTVAEASHLRHLAALVCFVTTSAALLEYLFKVQAVETLGRGDHLLRFFAIYYAATSLIAFALQALSSRAVLERF